MSRLDDLLMIISFLAFTEQNLGGPTPKELVKLLDQCDICQSQNSTPCISPSPSIMGGSLQRPGHEIMHGISVPNIDSLESLEERGAVGGVDKSQVTSL